MSFVNQTKMTVTPKAHINFMGGISYSISNPIARLHIAASSCFFGEPMYYHKDKNDTRPTRVKTSTLTDDQLIYLKSSLEAVEPSSWRGLSPAELITKAIDDALAFSPFETLKLAAYLRNVCHMRLTPQVILVRAAHDLKVKGTHLIREHAPNIIKRVDDSVNGLAYQLGVYGRKAIPNSLKRAWKDKLETFSEYELAKYRMEAKEVKLVDLINLCHAKSSAIHKLVKGELKNTETWEAIISAKGSSKDSWEGAIEHMNHMALLRNLRNFHKNSIDPDKYLDKLVKTAPFGQQLPFRYVSAYNAAKEVGSQGRVLDAIEECLKVSIGDLPKFNGKVISLCDNSGSAHNTMTSSMGTMRISTIANLTGILTGKASDDGYIGIFGDKLKTFPVRKTSSIFDDLKEVEAKATSIGEGTEHGIWLFWDKAIKEKQHWDHVFVYSDMQAGHGGLYGTGGYSDYEWGKNSNTYVYSVKYIDVAALIKAYRKAVNPNVKVYLVQVAGYQDTLIPEFYKNTYILGGWGDNVIKFASEMGKISYT